MTYQRLITGTSSLTLTMVLVQATIANATIDATIKTGPEINELSRKTTILIGIFDPQTKRLMGHGSGSIISKQGDICFGLTNQHVVAPQGRSLPFIVTTYDKQSRQGGKAVAFRDQDLAVIEFECKGNYEVVTLATYSLSEGQTVYVSGWPGTSSPNGDVVRQFTSGTISTILEQPKYGYQIGYTNVTKGGMSGGQVLDETGRLVGVHGLGVTDQAMINNKIGVDVKTGFNYGIPISFFMANAGANGVNLDVLGLKVAYSAPQRSGNVTAIAQNSTPTEYPPSQEDRIQNIHKMLGVVDRLIDITNRGIRTFCSLFGRC